MWLDLGVDGYGGDGAGMAGVEEAPWLFMLGFFAVAWLENGGRWLCCIVRSFLTIISRRLVVVQ